MSTTNYLLHLPTIFNLIINSLWTLWIKRCVLCVKKKYSYSRKRKKIHISICQSCFWKILKFIWTSYIELCSMFSSKSILYSFNWVLMLVFKPFSRKSCHAYVERSHRLWLKFWKRYMLSVSKRRWSIAPTKLKVCRNGLRQLG